MTSCCDKNDLQIEVFNFKNLPSYLSKNGNILFFSFIKKNYDFLKFSNIYFNKYFKSRSLKQNDKAYAYRRSSSRRNKDSCS